MKKIEYCSTTYIKAHLYLTFNRLNLIPKVDKETARLMEILILIVEEQRKR